MLKVILLFIYMLPLFAQTNPCHSRVKTTIEAGIYLPNESGNIENVYGSSSFSKDFGYKNTQASYFSIEVINNYDYIPNLYISYFNMQDNQSVTLTKAIQVANKNFDSNISSSIDYQVLSANIYQDLQLKGDIFTLFGRNYYTGDVEFDVGFTTKLFHWHYKVKDLTDLSRKTAWIQANEFIPLPYIGIKYFLYRFHFYANANDLAFSRAKSSTYKVGIEYRVTPKLYLNSAYIDERFNVLEKQDTIKFRTAGYKFSFKYSF